MNNIPREQLKQMIGQYGRSLSEDPKRCEALLRDFCGQYRKEINVLISAIKESVPVDLSNSQHRIPSDLLLAQLTKRLEDRLAIDPTAARWSVESWAIALGLISEENKNQVKEKPINNPTPTKPVDRPPPQQQSSSNRSNSTIPNPPPIEPKNSSSTPLTAESVVKNKNKSSFLKRIIPAIVVAFVGYGVVKQAHPDLDTSQNSDPGSALVGTWQEVKQSSQGDGSTVMVDFQSNGTFAAQISMATSQVRGTVYTTELYGIYRITGQNSFVRTMKDGRIAINGNWQFYCPPPQNSNSNGTCDGLFNGFEKEVGHSVEVSFKIDSSTQQLVINDQKYRRVR